MLSSILSWISRLWTKFTTRKQRQAEYEERVRRELEPYLRGTVWETKTTTTTYAPKPKIEAREWKSKEQIQKEKEADMILEDRDGSHLYLRSTTVFGKPIASVKRELDDDFDADDEIYTTVVYYEDGTKSFIPVDTDGHDVICDKADEWEKSGKWNENSQASKE